MTPNTQYKKVFDFLDFQIRELSDLKKSLTQLEIMVQNKLSEVEQKRKKSWKKMRNV